MFQVSNVLYKKERFVLPAPSSRQRGKTVAARLFSKRFTGTITVFGRAAKSFKSARCYVSNTVREETHSTDLIFAL
jgi:hypothetical protein